MRNLSMDFTIVDNASKSLSNIAKSFYGLEKSIKNFSDVKDPTKTIKRDLTDLNGILDKNSKHMTTFGKIANRVQSDFLKVSGYKEASANIDNLVKNEDSLKNAITNTTNVLDNEKKELAKVTRQYDEAIIAEIDYADNQRNLSLTVANAKKAYNSARNAIAKTTVGTEENTKAIEKFKKANENLNVVSGLRVILSRQLRTQHKNAGATLTKLKKEMDDLSKSVKTQSVDLKSNIKAHAETYSAMMNSIDAQAKLKNTFTKTTKALYFFKGGYKDIQKEIKKSVVNFKAVDKKIYVMRKSYGLLKNTLKVTNKAFVTSAKTIKSSSVVLSKFVGKSVLRGLSLIGQKLLGINEGFGRLGKRGKDVSEITYQLQRLGQALSDIVRGLSTRLAKATTSFVSSAISEFSDLENSVNKILVFAGISKTPKTFEAVEHSITDLAKTTMFSVDEIATGFENLAAVGDFSKDADGAKALDAYGEAMIKLATATGEQDLEKVGKILMVTMSAFGKSTSQITEVSDILTTVANQSALSVSQIGIAMQYANQSAVQAGISLEQTSAMIGFLSNQGFEASRAGTSLNKMFKAMASPTAKAQSAMEDLGISFFDASGNMKDMATIVDEVGSAFKNSGYTTEQTLKALTDIFGVQGARAMTAMLNNTQDLNDMFKLMNNTMGATQNGMDTMMNSMKGGFEQIKGTIESLKINLLDKLAPALMPFLAVLQTFLNSAGVQALIDKFGELLALVANQLLPIFSGILPVIGTMLEALMPIVTVLGNALTAMLQPLLDPNVIGAIVGIINVVVEVFSGLLPPIAKLVGMLVSALLPALNIIIQALVSALLPIFQALIGILIENMPMINEIFLLFADIIAQLLPPIGELLMALMPLVGVLIKLFLPVIKAILLVIMALMPILVLLIQAFTEIVKVISKLLVPVFQWLIDLFENKLMPVINAGIGLVVNVLNVLKNLLSSILKGIAKAFRALGSNKAADGIDRLAKSMDDATVSADKMGDAFENANSKTIDTAKYQESLDSADTSGTVDMKVNPVAPDGSDLNVADGAVEVAFDPTSTCDSLSNSYESAGSSIGDILTDDAAAKIDSFSNVPQDSTAYGGGGDTSNNSTKNITTGDVNIYVGQQDVNDPDELTKSVAEALADGIK